MEDRRCQRVSAGPPPQTWAGSWGSQVTVSHGPSARQGPSCHPSLHAAWLTIQSESVAKHPIQRPLWGLEHSWEGGERKMKTPEMPRKEEGRTERGVCPHLVLIDLDCLDLLGCAQVCRGRTARGILLASGSLTTSLPSDATLLTPKPHGPILAARQHLRAPLPQCQAVDVVRVAPEGPLQGERQCQDKTQEECRCPSSPGPALSP